MTCAQYFYAASSSGVLASFAADHLLERVRQRRADPVEQWRRQRDALNDLCRRRR